MKLEQVFVSNDRYILNRGMVVYQLYTTNGGRRWGIRKTKVLEVDHELGLVRLSNMPNGWTACFGDHRIFVKLALAKLEIKLRQDRYKAARKGASHV